MVKKIEKEEFEKEVLTNNNLCIVDFFATWCEPCKMLAPIIDKLSENTKFQNVINFYKIDIDGNEQLAISYNVDVVPTLAFIRNGEVINTEVGVKSKEELEQIIDKYIG